VILSIGLGTTLVPRVGRAWRDNIRGPLGGSGTSVAIDAAGDVIAGGTTAYPNTLSGSGFTAASKFAVVKLRGSDGKELWRREIGTMPDGNGAAAVALNAAGDVFAVGQTETSAAPDFTVVALHGNDGSDLWRVTIDGTAGRTDGANAVAVDAAGDVLAGGYTNNTGTNSDFFVVKLRGSDGTELWRQTIDGTAQDFDFVAALVVDAAGDVLAAGSTVNAGTGADFTVMKLRGSDGAVVWQQALDDPGNDFDRAWGVKVDAAGDAMAVGYMMTPGRASDIAAVKLRGSDGAVLWQQAIDGGGNSADEALAVSLDAVGDAVVAGYSVAFAGSPLFYIDFTVIKLAGADGSELWRRRISGDVSPVDYDNDIAYAVAVDAGGDVFAAGSTQRAVTYDDFTLVKLSGATGSELWRRVIKGATKDNFYEKAVALAVDPAGHAVAVGNTTSTPGSSDLTVLDLREEISGQLLNFSDRSPSTRKLTIISKDRGIIGAGPAGPADPTFAGATLQLVNPNTGEHDEFPLPASNWQAVAALNTSTAIPRGFLYSDRAQANGPCTKVVISSDGRFKASCKGAQIQFSLDESAQGQLGVNLQAATGATLHCMLFGGQVSKDKPGRFHAKGAGAPLGCPSL
jgi:hypothetical protein